MVLWAHLSCISLLTAPRVGGLNPTNSDSLFLLMDVQGDSYRKNESTVTDSRNGLKMCGWYGDLVQINVKREWHTRKELDSRRFDSKID